MYPSKTVACGSTQHPSRGMAAILLSRRVALAEALLAFAGTARAQIYWDSTNSVLGTATWAAPTTNNSTPGWSSSDVEKNLPLYRK